jgi:hypothetical protein
MRRSGRTLFAALAAAGLIGASGIGSVAQDAIVIDAASVPITIDGDASDWADVEGTAVMLEQLDLSLLPPEQADEIEFGPIEPIEVQFKVANDADNIYMLVEAPTAYVYGGSADMHKFSPAIAVQAKIEPEASTHMGSEEADLIASTGMVDIWHWELDCGPGELSGGGASAEGVVAGGNDEPCNMDDEYSLTPDMREDDGGGDEANETAENSLLGSWSHSAAEVGGDGTWVFEMARPLSTGDSQDANWEAGGVAELVLAWWDPNETLEGWTDAGHLTNAYDGWITVNLN